ncbi:MAG: hypothetical protein AAFQ42_02270 [Pseudomonadota bacterium]
MTSAPVAELSRRLVFNRARGHAEPHTAAIRPSPVKRAALVLWVGILVALLPSSAAYAQAEVRSPWQATASAGSTPRADRDAEATEFRRPDDLVRWITAYRAAPTPERVPDAVQAMSRMGLFRDAETAAFYIGFIAGVLADNQVDAPRLIDAFFPLPPAQQAVVIKAIAYSGLPDWKRLLGRFAEYMPARKTLIAHYLYGPGKTLATVPLDNGNAVVDTLWGFYFATGGYEPVLRIINALAWAAEDDNVQRPVIAHMAKVTLSSNAANDENLLALYQVQLGYVSGPTRKHLREVVDAIERFETHKVRRGAEQAIREIRARGPVKAPSAWAKADQIGQTVLAVGCVVASALGHPEIGVPCVITGAVYSGLSKLADIGWAKPGRP